MPTRLPRLQNEGVNPFPKKWSDRDILTRLQDAEKRTERGKKTNKQKPVEDEGNPPKTQGVDGRGRCKIRRSCDEHVMAREAIAALSTADNLYQRFGFLVGVTRQTEETVEHGVARKGRTPRIRDLKRGPLREARSEYCFFWKTDKDGNTYQVRVPGSVVDILIDRGEYDRIRPIAGITEVPVLRPNGTIVDEPGYDPDTQLIYSPCGSSINIGSPVHEDAVTACGELLDLVGDFPFAGDEHVSGWLA